MTTRLSVGDADTHLKNRLSAELTAFHNAATGAYDERDLPVRATDDSEPLPATVSGQP